jgi:hypothetical protein
MRDILGTGRNRPARAARRVATNRLFFGTKISIKGTGARPSQITYLCALALVVGRTDARAERPANDPHGPEDLAATLYHLLGIDPDAEFYTPEGRPVRIVNQGRVIRDLL